MTRLQGDPKVRISPELFEALSKHGARFNLKAQATLDLLLDDRYGKGKADAQVKADLEQVIQAKIKS